MDDAAFNGMIPPSERDRKIAEGRGAHHKAAGEYMHLVNAGGFCQFVMSAANTAKIPDWINETTGWNVTKEELLKTGERIANLRLVFELREGGNPAARAVAKRLYDGGELPAGPNKDILLDIKTLETEYLKEAGWDAQTTKPGAEKLRELGWDDLIPVVHG